MGSLAPAEIRALAKLVDELDYYQLLEISRQATGSELKKAYYESSRRFHPDASRHLDAELRRAVERIAKRLSEAYSVVRDPRRRQAYDAHLEGRGGVRMQLAQADAAHAGARKDEAGTTPQGRRFFRLAEQDLRAGNSVSAARNLQMALTFEPDNPRFKEALESTKRAS